MNRSANPIKTFSVVTLGVGDEVFAVEVEMVREILDHIPASRLPNAPPFLIGVIDVRGSTVPVIDLRRKLGLEPEPPTPNTRILVLEVMLGERQLLIGLQADRVFEVAEFEEKDLETAPDFGINWKSEYIKSIARLRGEFVIIFDMHRLFASEEVVALCRVP